ncbi:MAG: hypothetical protein CM1200mP20_02400 [Pseudomonadota bacterium]|nr:MAG: hypothetical protein CM1200mP20_02400 [Pseudomonadota bacterium]
MVLERWNRDNETLIMLTAGFGPGYLLKPTLFLLLIGQFWWAASLLFFPTFGTGRRGDRA